MENEHKHHRITSWNELFDRMVDVGLGAALLTAESAEKLVNDLVSRGQVPADEGTSLIDRLLLLGRQQRDMLQEMVEKNTEMVLDRMHLARQGEVDELRQRIEVLEKLLITPPTACPHMHDDSALSTE